MPDTSNNTVPELLRRLLAPATAPVLPELSDVGKSLNDAAQQEAYQAYGPEAAKNTFFQKVLHGGKSLLDQAGAGVANTLAGMTPTDVMAGAAGPKIAGPYYAARGAVSSLDSVKQAQDMPTPENVQKALSDLSMTFLGAHSAVAQHTAVPESKLPENVEGQTPATLTQPNATSNAQIPGLLHHAQNVTDIVNNRGGATYSLSEGDRTGQNLYSVAMMPERDRKVTGQVSPQSVAQFINDNADIYANEPRANVGVWNAPDGNHYLEVSAATHDLQNALDVARKHNQYAIYDLKNGRDIPTGGTGGVTDAPPVNEEIRNAANEYNAERGRPQISGSYLRVSPQANDIADAYDTMQHNPSDPAVARSYNAFKRDVSDQYNYATQKMGMKFEPWTQEGQPYKNSAEMMQDVMNNHHLFFFTGGDFPSDHPMTQVDPSTGLTFNDEFRAVHDLFGHAQSGFEFGPRGEENAWFTHKQMMSPEAVPAMTSETRGQNSWVNFGQHLRRDDGSVPVRGDADYIPMQDRPFAPQKAGLLPPEFYDRGEVQRLNEVTPSPTKEFMTLRHYSDAAVKGNVLSGSKRGVSGIGQEQQRVGMGAPGGVYFYTNGGQGEPEITSRPYEYQTQGHYALADLKDNPVFHQAQQEAFQRIKSSESAIPGLSPQQAPISDGEAYLRSINEAEHALQRAGYDGYTTTAPEAHNQNIAFLFGDHAVQPAGAAEPAPQRVLQPSLVSQAGGARADAIMPSRLIERVLPKSVDDKAQAAISKAGGNYQGPWGFAAAGLPEQYAFTDPVTGTTLAAAQNELKPNVLAEKMAKSRLDLLNSDEQSRIGPRAIKQFSDTLASLPSVQEFENIAKAGLVGKDWYPHAREAFAQLARVAPDYFRSGDEIKFANVMGSTSPNQPVETNIREGLGVWKRWVDAGRPTQAGAIHKLLSKIPDNELTSKDSKVPNLTSSLMGQDLFTGRKAYFKAPSFGQALGGKPDAGTPDETFVGDTHMADAYGLEPAKVFKSGRLYYAMAAHTRAVARKLNLPTAAAQASIWAAVQSVKAALGENPDAAPEEIASMVTPDRIASEMKDMADIMLHDSVSRNLIKSMLPEGTSLDDFDQGLKAIVEGRQGTEQAGQDPAAARGIAALAARLQSSGKRMRRVDRMK